MIKWEYTINFKPFWHADIPAEEKGNLAAAEIRRLAESANFTPYDLDELLEIADDFDHISGDGTDEFTPTEDFDARMYDLYNLADSLRIWVRTTI